MIRSDEQTSRLAKVKSSTSEGAVVCDEREPAKAHTLVIGRLTTGRWEVGERGLGISAVTAPVQIVTAEDRGVIVPMKPVKADGGKDARKEAENAGTRRKTRTVVPARPKPNERENRTARSMPHMRARSPVSTPTARWDMKDDSALETLKQNRSFPQGLPTGEPYAGNPPVRFGGRGGP